MEDQDNRPLFSIITCTYNSEKYVRECLDSVKVQTFRNFEHIFIDGYSTDETLKLIEEYTKESTDIKIKLIQSEAKGIANAMNMGIENSTGKIIHILHSDDFYSSSKTLEIVKDYFDKSPHMDILIGNRTMLFGKDFKVEIKHMPFQAEYAADLIKLWPWIPHASTFVKKGVYDKYGMFDEKYKIAMDYDFFFKTLKHCNVEFVEENLTTFRRHGESTSFKLSNTFEMLSEVTKVKKAHKEHKEKDKSRKKY